MPLHAHTETGPLIHQQHLDREPADIEIELRHWWFPRNTLRTEVALEISTVYWVEKFWPELAITTADKTLATLAQQLYNRPSLMMDSSLKHRFTGSKSNSLLEVLHADQSNPDGDLYPFGPHQNPAPSPVTGTNISRLSRA